MVTSDDAKHLPAKFESVRKIDVPMGRNGKHKEIVTRLLQELAELEPSSAMKIPLSELPDSKENIRSALNRATRERDLNVATSSDSDYLYVWKV